MFIHKEYLKYTAKWKSKFQLSDTTKDMRTEDFKTAPESGRNDGTIVFRARGNILRGISGNVSFTGIIQKV